MEIDVILFTLLAPSTSMGTRSIYISIMIMVMGDAPVPWFGPIPPIGRQGTQQLLKK
jgi:hypothetical protein